jgi:acyl transferase domain-containing protein
MTMVLFWSAPDAARERGRRAALMSLIASCPPAALPALLAREQAAADPALPVRGAVAAGDRTSLLAMLAGPEPCAPVRTPPRRLALLLPGHGFQQPAMGARLYGWHPVFTAAVDEVLDALGAAGERLRVDWLGGNDVDSAESGQPLLFALGYALGRVLCGWRAAPDALLGHSVGELAAATLAGVLEVRAAAALLSRRRVSYREAPAGGLVAVAAPAAALTAYLTPNVRVGVVNGPEQTMLAGPAAELDAVVRRLRADGRTVVPARIPVPFHSPALAPLARRFTADLAGVRLGAPTTPLYSTASGALLTAAQAETPDFWGGQVARPVLFWPALRALLDDGDALLLDGGPGRALTALARRHAAVRDGHSAVVAMLPARPGDDRLQLALVAARLWRDGHLSTSLPGFPPAATSAPMSSNVSV